MIAISASCRSPLSSNRRRTVSSSAVTGAIIATAASANFLARSPEATTISASAAVWTAGAEREVSVRLASHAQNPATAAVSNAPRPAAPAPSGSSMAESSWFEDAGLAASGGGSGFSASAAAQCERSANWIREARLWYLSPCFDGCAAYSAATNGETAQLGRACWSAGSAAYGEWAAEGVAEVTAARSSTASGAQPV
jgi:hypothetical protein